MSEQEKEISPERNGLTDVLEKLLEYQQKNGEKNTLIMLALLNLLGIVWGLNAQRGEEANQSNSPWGQLPFNPAMLLNLPGGGQGRGQAFDFSSLMGLLGNFLGGMPGGGMVPKALQSIAPENPPVGKAAGKMKVERNVYKPPGELKGKPEKDALPGQRDKGQKQGIIKWDFGEEKKT